MASAAASKTAVSERIAASGRLAEFQGIRDMQHGHVGLADKTEHATACGIVHREAVTHDEHARSAMHQATRTLQGR